MLLVLLIMDRLVLEVHRKDSFFVLSFDICMG